ncbi:MAG: 50S ribosomal protein P1 [Candidatus Bathyarchaeia archaeon]
MEYVYAAMLLHKAGKPIDEDSVTKVLQSAGIEVNPMRVKALVAALSEVNIDETIKSAPSFMGTVAPTSPSVAPASEQKPKVEEKKEEKKEEEALEGLGSLFG